MKFWITRDKDGGYGENRVYIWKTAKSPQKLLDDGTVTFQDPDAIIHEKVMSMLVEEFILLYDFKPKAGSCKRYDIPKLKEFSRSV